MKKDNSRSTILVISMGFLFLYIIFSWKWALVVSFVAGVTGILSSYLSQKIELAWMMLTRLLGYILPNILLTIVFFLFLFPIALLTKLFKKDPLMLSRKYSTYFLDIHRRTDRKDFEKTW